MSISVGGDASQFLRPVAEGCAATIEAIGIGIIVALAMYAMLGALIQLVRGSDTQAVTRQLRQTLGQGILVGLEFLVAADIVHTVAVELTFSSVGVLAVVVLIRTFLSFTLEVELTGRWPWQTPQ